MRRDQKKAMNNLDSGQSSHLLVIGNLIRALKDYKGVILTKPQIYLMIKLSKLNTFFMVRGWEIAS